MIRINHPRDVKLLTGGTTAAALEWDKSFSGRWENRYQKAQKYVDSEVLRLNEKYVPFRQGNLKRSGTLGTVIGSGDVRYIAPYARYQYYGKVMVGPAPKRVTDRPLRYHSGDANRGAKWFEVMKARHGQEIIRGARKLAGGGL